MFIVVSKYLVPKAYVAITVFPFVFFAEHKTASDPLTRQHERIHLRQQAEMLVLPFFIWYFAEYLIRRIRSGSHSAAYRAISFEAEAYNNENDAGFLQDRPFWNFVKYMNRKS